MVAVVPPAATVVSRVVSDLVDYRRGDLSDWTPLSIFTISYYLVPTVFTPYPFDVLRDSILGVSPIRSPIISPTISIS